MLSLRIKFTLALLITSLAAIGIVGIVVQWFIFNKFSQHSMEQAFEGFQSDVVAYISQYGSWEQAQQTERFGQFERRRRALVGQTSIQRTAPLPEDNANVPPPVLDEAGRPPFKFVLMDPQGVILMGDDTFKQGERAPPSLFSQSKPILINNLVTALAAPIGQPNLNDIDRAYFVAIRGALSYALITACFLALLLGLIFSRWLSLPLRRLTSAIRSMQSGNIRQEVKVNSYDEIGVLLKTFNRMSEDIATAYEALEKSNDTIREQAEQLKETSIRDELTQLYNRRQFNEQSEKMFAHSKRHNHPIVFTMADIDHFKQVNDNFSHAIGDKVLCEVANIIRNNTRENDLAARYGGEEFVIAFPETPLAQAVKLCERLRDLISDYPWHKINPELQITISMGLNADLQFEKFEQMLAAADSKLYEAKNTGRNRICY